MSEPTTTRPNDDVENAATEPAGATSSMSGPVEEPAEKLSKEPAHGEGDRKTSHPVEEFDWSHYPRQIELLEEFVLLGDLDVIKGLCQWEIYLGETLETAVTRFHTHQLIEPATMSRLAYLSFDKAKLIDYCTKHGLPVMGSRLELAERVAKGAAEEMADIFGTADGQWQTTKKGNRLLTDSKIRNSIQPDEVFQLWINNESTDFLHIEKIRSLIREGVANGDTPYWNEHLNDWDPLRRLMRRNCTSVEKAKSMKEAGVGRVRFLNAGQDDRCLVCALHHSQIFEIDDAPSIPPVGCICTPYCRAILTAVK